MDTNPVQNEKLSIKNLLFTKAIPNYILPISTDGYLTFACRDCGDRFIVQSSYESHINRKSLKITYFCRHCSTEKIFFNRCDLLSHIRSHAFKTATISISDLNIEPLPLSYYNHQIETNAEIDVTLLPPSSTINQDENEIQNEKQVITCFDCKMNIYSSGIIYRDRAKHYTQYTNKLYSCPICLLTLTTQCALKAHLRIHLKEPPFYCPDCGIYLTKTAVVYPYTHDCESFKMMRATAKLKCMGNNCNKIFHPNESNKHLRTHHLKHVYKCPVCSVACYKLDNMQKHLKSFHLGKLQQIDLKKLKHIDFLQCEMCPGRLVIPGQIERHLKSHENFINSVYPCWTCGVALHQAKDLLEHQKFNHPDSYIEKICGKVSQDPIAPNRKILNIASTDSLTRRPFKKCQCFTKNTSNYSKNFVICKCTSESTRKIICHLCKLAILYDWNMIKKHYSIYHKEHVCLDAKILVKKLNIKNFYGKRKKANQKENVSCNNDYPSGSNTIISIDNDNFFCRKCGHGYETKYSLEQHIVEHRDPFMAYQCMECAESFIAKRSFSTHLLLEHGINDVNNYIEEKKCYSEDSFNLQQHDQNLDQNEPVKENQCNICKEQFSDSTDLTKHFRVHGMAFLMQNTKSISPEKI